MDDGEAFLRYGYVSGKDPPVIIPNFFTRERVRRTNSKYDAAVFVCAVNAVTVCTPPVVHSPENKQITSCIRSATLVWGYTSPAPVSVCPLSPAVFDRRSGRHGERGEDSGQTQRPKRLQQPGGEVPVCSCTPEGGHGYELRTF